MIRRRGIRKAGSVTVMVLVLLVVFIIIGSAIMQYIARQSHQTTDATNRARAFGLADAGVTYAQWLLDGEGGDKLPEELLQSPPEGAINHNVEAGGKIAGHFSTHFLAAAADTLQLRAVGRDNLRTDLCQVVLADIRQTNDGWKTITWDQQAGYPCELMIGECDPYELNAAQSVTLEGVTVANRLADTDCAVDSGSRRADFFTIRLNETVPMEMTIDGQDIDFTMTVLDEQGAEVAASVPAQGNNCPINSGHGACIGEPDDLIIGPGLYHVKVTSALPGGTDVYTMRIYNPTGL